MEMPRRMEMARPNRRRIRILTAASVIAAAIAMLAATTAPAGAAPAHSFARTTAAAAAQSVQPSTPAPEAIQITGAVQLTNRAAPSMCLSIAGSTDDSPAVIWPCSKKSLDQYWALGDEYGNSPWYELRNDENQCLGLLGGDTAKGTDVYGWKCQTGAANQYWGSDDYCTTTSNGTTYTWYDLVNLAAWNATDGLASGVNVAGVYGGGTTEGTKLVLWSNNQKCNNQVWYFGSI
jgi:hypothetical protein